MRLFKNRFETAFIPGLCALLLLCAGCGAPEAVPAAAVEDSLTLADQPTITETETSPVTEEPEEPVPYSDAWMIRFEDQMESLKLEFPDGCYWNHIGHDPDWIGVTDIPCDHASTGPLYCNLYDCASTRACGWDYGTQCAGFAGMLSDRIFGADAPVRRFYDYDEIRPGDQARINGDTHTVFILEKNDEYVIVAECNAGGMNTCRIAWGRKIPRSEMGGFYLTRSL